MERAVAACPEVEVLFQGIPINCLIDTGSQVTTITESFFRRLTDCFVCVEVLRPSQPNGVMSSAVSLPNHTFTGQA